MASPLKICFAASEIAPFVKTGGLADVAAALPFELHRCGHDVRRFLPLYSAVDAPDLRRVPSIQDVAVKLDWRTYSFSLWSSPRRDGGPATYFVDCPELFHRSGVYTSDPDEPLRFVLFSRAVVECCQRMQWAPDVFHCNDWHTALLPLLLRTVYAWDALFAASRTALTIHNVGYQGVFPAHVVGELGLGPWTHLLDQSDLHAGRVNFLRSGLIYCDLVTTVSPTYAREIQTPEYGMGLDGLLRARGASVVGVLNGVDYTEWSPERDRFIPHRYSTKRMTGKAKNKRYASEHLGLDRSETAPLVVVVSRLVHQKGFELCFSVLPELLGTRDLRLAVLGSGEAAYEEFFSSLQRRFPGLAAYHRGYDNELAHVLEAGGDMLLMPSRYEPCGLNQMFSLRYGTIPIVRRTGGLADTVTPFDPATGEGTGFAFEHFTADGLAWATRRALEVWADPAAWRRLVRNAMAQDFSWKRSAARYADLFYALRDGRT